MKSAETIIKENFNDVLLPALGTARQNSLTAKDQARSFEELNKQKLNNRLKYRNQVFWKLTRDNQLSKLYSDCLKQDPPYVPRKFRGDDTFKRSEEEFAIYRKLAEQRLAAEIEVLNLRGQKNMEKISKMDEEIFQFFETKEENPAILQELKEKWQENTKKDEGIVIKKWAKKIVEEKAIIGKETSSEAMEQPLKTSQAQTFNQGRSTRQNATTHTPITRQRQDFASTRPKFQPPQSLQQHHQGSVRSKNFNSPFLQPPPLIPLNSSTFHPTSWHNVTSHY